MAGTTTACSSAADTRPPPTTDTNSRSHQGTMAMQAGGNALCVQYRRRMQDTTPRSPREGLTGAWDAVISFFGRINTPSQRLKRSASSDIRVGPDKPPREDDTIYALGKQEPTPVLPPKPATPFPILALPPELLCEILARISPTERYLQIDGSTLATTCKAFHAALKALSAIPPYRNDDVLARRIAGMERSDQILSTVDAIAKQRPFTREWAMRTVIFMARSMSVQGRQYLIIDVLDRARWHSELWALELMRYFARWIPDTDSQSLDMLTRTALELVPANDETRFARLRVLAQLAQRISPNDVPGTVLRWESIYQSMSAIPHDEDYVALRALRQGFGHLTQKFRARFSIGNETNLFLSLLDGLSRTRGPGSDPYMAACSEEELDCLPPPEPWPGTVPPIDPMRAYEPVIKPVPRADSLPAALW